MTDFTAALETLTEGFSGLASALQTGVNPSNVSDDSLLKLIGSIQEVCSSVVPNSEEEKEQMKQIEQNCLLITQEVSNNNKDESAVLSLQDAISQIEKETEKLNSQGK